MINVHILASVRLCHAALPNMIERGTGAIINVSSLSAYLFSPTSTVYSASKMFLNTFTQALQVELKKSGVRVMSMCPGFTHTGFHDASGHNKREIPKFLWMKADKVVNQSLKALRRGKIIFVPGFKNRMFLRMYRFFLTSWIVKKLLYSSAEGFSKEK